MSSTPMCWCVGSNKALIKVNKGLWPVFGVRTSVFKIGRRAPIKFASQFGL